MDELNRPPGDDLEQGIVQLHALMTAVHAALLGMVAAYDKLECWKGDGATAMASWLTARLGVSSQTASEWTRVARALEELPEIAAAYREAVLAWDQVREVTRFAKPETDAVLAADAVRFSASALERMARRSRPRTRAQDEEAQRSRELKLSWDRRKETLRMSGRLPGSEGAIVERVIEELARKAPPEPESGTFEAWEARCADALVELASTRLAEESDADRATVVVHVDADVLAGAEGVAEVDGGPVVSGEAARRMACDARWQVIVDGPEGLPVGIGRTSRKVPAWLVRELRRRDVGCRFPGCRRRRWVAAHHIEHWARGGSTDLDNLVMLCAYHHRLVHEGGWSLAGNPNGDVVFIRPDGRPYEPGPQPLRRDIRRRFFGDDEDAIGPPPNPAA